MEINKNIKVSVLIPCYNVESQIVSVISSIPSFVTSIIVVNDKSTDNTANILMELSKQNDRVKIIDHEFNLGVGGAMKTAFRQALKSDCTHFIKLDGDGQMDTRFIPELVEIVDKDRIEFSKGNRFFDLDNISKMPLIRRFGNIGLGFLVKAASGYWNIFDPTNGYFCISRSALCKLNIDNLANRYFFESSLIIELYYIGADIKDVVMPAIYGDEKSNLSITKTLFSFPIKLLKAFIKRIVYRYFLFDFNICSIYILFGTPMLIFGIFFGGINWIYYSNLAVSAPVGTVILSLLTIVLGFQLLLSAIQYDIEYGKFKN